MNPIQHLFLRFFDCQNLFEVFIKRINETIIDDRFRFIILNQNKAFYLDDLIEFRGAEYAKKARKRLNEPSKYTCLAIVNEEDRLCYSCWIKNFSFYEDKLNLKINLKKDQVYFFDDFTIPKFRGKGLHKYMMIKRINYTFENGGTSALITIQCFNAPALKVKNQLKFRLVKRKKKYKSGSFSRYLKILLMARLIEKK
jgi:hypothetical protein